MRLQVCARAMWCQGWWNHQRTQQGRIFFIYSCMGCRVKGKYGWYARVIASHSSSCVNSHGPAAAGMSTIWTCTERRNETISMAYTLFTLTTTETLLNDPLHHLKGSECQAEYQLPNCTFVKLMDLYWNKIDQCTAHLWSMQARTTRIRTKSNIILEVCIA